MAQKPFTGYDKLLEGLSAMGQQMKKWAVGSGGGAKAAGGGLLGFGKKTAGAAAHGVDNAVGGYGRSATKHTGTTIALTAIPTFFLVKWVVGKFKKKKDNIALGTENSNMSMAMQNAELRAQIAEQRQAGSMTSAMLGSNNRADGGAVGRLQASRGVGAGIPPYN